MMSLSENYFNDVRRDCHVATLLAMTLWVDFIGHVRRDCHVIRHGGILHYKNLLSSKMRWVFIFRAEEGFVEAVVYRARPL